MQKRILKRSLLATIVIGVLFVVAVPLTVAAISGHANAEDTTKAPESASQTKSDNNQATEQRDARDTAEARLTDARLNSCKNRQTAITNIMTRINDRGQKQLDLFSGIATKVESFYTEKGQVLSNYDTLVADVNAKKAAAQLAVNAAKTPTATFTCDGTNPMGVASSFKSTLKAEIAALNNYKTAVKNLIVGVKSVQSQVKETN